MIMIVQNAIYAGKEYRYEQSPRHNEGLTYWSQQLLISISLLKKMMAHEAGRRCMVRSTVTLLKDIGYVLTPKKEGA